MSSWYRLSLGDPLLADALREEIAQAAKAAALAVYSRHEGEGQLHCELVLYFPEQSYALAKTYNAMPGGDPGAGLSLMSPS